MVSQKVETSNTVSMIPSMIWNAHHAMDCLQGEDPYFNSRIISAVLEPLSETQITETMGGALGIIRHPTHTHANISSNISGAANPLKINKFRMRSGAPNVPHPIALNEKALTTDDSKTNKAGFDNHL